MKVSEQWIREWVNPSLSTQELVDQLTMAGLEIDGIEPVASRFSGVIVAEVLEVAPHPDADKLRVCRVNNGRDVLQVVCGAPNVRAGLRVPYAQIGAELSSSTDGKAFTIRQAKLRGVESNGMLCSAQELGLSDSSDGLLELASDAPVGANIREYLQLDDHCLELDLTPNRGDCLGVIGVSREIGVLNAMQAQGPDVHPVAPLNDARFPVVIAAPEQCPRYLGRVIKGIDISATTPYWMAEKLRRSGIRTIDPVVDVTNYVLLELGQPMHAFDLAKLSGAISVRLAVAGESLTLLGGKEVRLTPDVLVIADQKGPLAMAGVMGGAGSGVSETTQDVFLECAFFSPLALAGRARRYGLHTDASHRYERGVDFELQRRAIERATALLLDIVGGEPGPVDEVIGTLPERATITLSFTKLTQFLGLQIPSAEVADILQRLGAEIVMCSDTAITVRAPSFRFDWSLDVDLIEEVARVYGYNRLPRTRSLNRATLGESTETQTELSLIKERLMAFGYQEVITYSFVSPEIQSLISPEEEGIALQNPISAEMSVMRTSLWPGLLTTLQYNANRQQVRVRIFESGLVFLKRGGQVIQPSVLAGLIYGTTLEELWCDSKKNVDFFDIKGDLESLLSLSRGGMAFEFSPASHPALHPGQCASITLNGEDVGVVGALSPTLQRQLGFSNRAYLFEIKMESLLNAQVPRVKELSRFPEVKRDLALVIDESVPAARILDLVRDCAGEALADLRIFDVYQGDAIEKSKKSIALGLTLRHPSRTLGDEDINAIINSCVKELEKQFNAKLRN